MSDNYDQSMEEEGGEPPGQDPRIIRVVNGWLNDLTDDGTDMDVVRNDEFFASELAEYAGVSTPEASQMLQGYREANYWMDERCQFVIAHEGHYGPRSPWRILGTTHPLVEAQRRVYRMNSVRHMTWEFYDHARKEVKSFGAEVRQALVQVDSTTNSLAGQNRRLAVRDYARDLLQTMRANGQRMAQGVVDTLGVPVPQRPEYMRYFFDGFWPYVEVMVDEEVQLLEAMIR